MENYFLKQTFFVHEQMSAWPGNNLTGTESQLRKWFKTGGKKKVYFLTLEIEAT